jgi:hypothetical protein
MNVVDGIEMYGYVTIFFVCGLISLFLPLHLRIGPCGPFPFRINYEIMTLTDSQKDFSDGGSALVARLLTYTGEHKHRHPYLEWD